MKNEQITRTEKNGVTAVATFGGGCFWCTEAIFQELEGVRKVSSGYSGGTSTNPSYQDVCSGITGHAEVIQVTYEPNKISFEELLVIFMTTHNPTLMNQQGADKGTQYRSIIFFESDKERAIIEVVLKELQPYFDKPIVTEVKKFEKFFMAEEKHQEYYRLNKNFGYCTAVIEPKLAKFRKLHSDKLKNHAVV